MIGFSNRPTYDPVQVIAVEWDQLSFTRRLLIRLASRNMAGAAGHLSRNPHLVHTMQYVGKTRDEKPRGFMSSTPMSDAADRVFAGSRY